MEKRLNYILDTDTLIYFFNRKKSVVERFSSLSNLQLSITIINHAELSFGAFHSERPKQNLAKLKAFLQEIRVLPFCENASYIYAEQKSALNRKGTPLDDMDLMIGSIALFHKMILVTNNIKHFSRIRGLKLENWNI